jgi:vacuole morphology and inheritance protein 14
VKNGAELLDRLLKDIVAESAPMYFPQFAETEKVRRQTQDTHSFGLGIMVESPDEPNAEATSIPIPKQKAFSLAHFMPLLSERIYVISPFTRSYLVSWINVLDSVPDLELVSFLPEFLDGLL